MRPCTTLIIFLLALRLSAWAQSTRDTVECARKNYGQTNFPAKNTIAAAEENDYDIKHLKFDLTLSAVSPYISGNVSTIALVTSPAMSTYAFELSDTMTIDSVSINGVARSYSAANGVCRVQLSTPVANNNLFTAQVYYHGYPRNATDINSPGFHNAEHVTFSSVEPYFASTWWPCKQSLLDKIDSVDMSVTVPDSVRVGSNGALAAVIPTTPGYHRYEWKERYPIAYYLLSVAVSAYDEYSYQMHFSGSSDSMLIMNYVPPGLLPQVQPMLDTTGLLVDYYSSLFGRYPFWKEKYGHCYSPSFVNMENQTMTSAHLTRLTVIAHELTHQWFGDNVTCGSWKDIWLNEGFATYGQYLCYEHFNGKDTAKRFMNDTHNHVLSESWGTVFSYDTADWPRIFDSRLTYDKGTSVVHMLRFIAGDDAQFFSILQTYQQQFAGKTATTDDLRHIAETILKRDLYAFFYEWIYCDGFPAYNVAWNQVNDAVYLRISQSASFPTSISLFKMPVEVKLFSIQGDTTVTIDCDQPIQIFRFFTQKVIDSIAIDPEQWLLCKTSSPVKDASLSLLPADVEVYPNPSAGTINILYRNLDNALFILFDASGKKVTAHTLPGASGLDQLDIQFLPAGVYSYNVVSNGKSKTTGTIAKE